MAISSPSMASKKGGINDDLWLVIDWLYVYDEWQSYRVFIYQSLCFVIMGDFLFGYVYFWVRLFSKFAWHIGDNRFYGFGWLNMYKFVAMFFKEVSWKQACLYWSKSFNKINIIFITACFVCPPWHTQYTKTPALNKDYAAALASGDARVSHCLVRKFSLQCYV